MSGLLGLAGGTCYLLFGGLDPTDVRGHVSSLLGHILLPLVASAVVMLMVNAPLLAVVVRISAGVPVRITAIEAIKSGWTMYLGYGVIAFPFVVLWEVDGLGPASLLLVLAPLALAQWTISQQVAEQQVHYRTVETLVAAVEARHPTTKGLSEATAAVAGLIGDEMRLRPSQGEALRFAATLHNVGLVAPSTRARNVDGRIAPQQMQDVLRHPEQGVAMLRDITFLSKSVDAIRHHHERWDGRGYPGGLAGSDIPLLARVIAVSDAFIASTRGPAGLSTEDAMTVLRLRAGTQLCPGCVDALERVALKGRLDAVVPILTAAPGGADHDDPAVSDLLASMNAMPVEVLA
ncbi:HD-GYP domain-containing protein [Luteipulveratus mongoliensis]|nr:HD domain-containing phosphohydrolase [Luteipulveratus mongoliensis]